MLRLALSSFYILVIMLLSYSMRPLAVAARLSSHSSILTFVSRNVHSQGRSLRMGVLSTSKPNLYVYNHCPFCVRAMMIFGLKKIPRQLIYLDNDDVDTPTSLVGRKVVPILELVSKQGERVCMPESMDIVKRIDEDDRFGEPLLKPASGREDLKEFFMSMAEHSRRLTRPRFSRSNILPEFHTKSARDTFIQNHPLKPPSNYEENYQNKALIEEMSEKLNELEPMIYSPECITEGGISYDDIDAFGKLRGLTIVKGLKFPPKVRKYLDTMSQKSEVALCDQLAL